MFSHHNCDSSEAAEPDSRWFSDAEIHELTRAVIRGKASNHEDLSELAVGEALEKLVSWGACIRIGESRLALLLRGQLNVATSPGNDLCFVRRSTGELERLVAWRGGDLGWIQ